MNIKGARFAFAELFGVFALIAVLFGYLAAMGSYRINGVGFFLMPITVAAYLLFTWLSQKRPTARGYWIMYSAKIAFVIGLFLLAPLIGSGLARLVNG